MEYHVLGINLTSHNVYFTYYNISYIDGSLFINTQTNSPPNQAEQGDYDCTHPCQPYSNVVFFINVRIHARRANAWRTGYRVVVFYTPPRLQFSTLADAYLTFYKNYCPALPYCPVLALFDSLSFNYDNMFFLKKEHMANIEAWGVAPTPSRKLRKSSPIYRKLADPHLQSYTPAPGPYRPDIEKLR